MRRKKNQNEIGIIRGADIQSFVAMAIYWKVINLIHPADVTDKTKTQ